MINFRYHVVSLTAVFLALAIGLVVGTAALNSPLSDELNDRVRALTQQNDYYRAQVNQLEDDAGKQEQYATESAPFVLHNQLTGRRILVVSMQATAPYVDNVLQMLALAGAKVTGQVEIEDRFTDPANSETLLDLAHTTLPPNLANVPVNSDGVETASFLLASVLADHTPAIPAEASQTVLTAFTEGRFIVLNKPVTGPAEGVIVLAAQPYTDREADGKNTNMVTMATQFDNVSRLVVAANGAAGSGNVVASLRGDPTLSKTISTVDYLATPQGKVALVLAMAEQINNPNKAGHYGRDAGATSLLPKLPT
ncbi:MAG: copper transporter [Micromonosporaceae bacterium]|nr:copper transporter [Micromonosporaceae bacterium]